MPEDKDVCETPSKYLPLYFNYLNQFALLTDEQVGRLIRALLLHGRDGADPDFDKNSSIYMAYSFILDNSERAAERLRESKVRAGRIRAAAAEKDEKGRFLPSKSSTSPAETQHNPAQSSTSSKTSYNKDKYKDKNKDKDKDKENIYTHRRLIVDDGYTAHARDDDYDDLSEREKKILRHCQSVIGSGMTVNQQQAILQATKGMKLENVMYAISIADENNARTPDYLLKTILTQKENPQRRPLGFF